MTIGFYIPLRRGKDFVGVIKVPNQLTLDERKGNSPEQPWLRQINCVGACSCVCTCVCLPMLYSGNNLRSWTPCFFGIPVSLAQSWPHRGGWPACKPQQPDRLTFPSAEIIMYTALYSAFIWLLEDQTQVLMLASEALYQWSSLSNPSWSL